MLAHQIDQLARFRDRLPGRGACQAGEQDLHTTVGELSEAVGPVMPTVLAADSHVVDALAHLEWSEGEAYPAVIVDHGQGKPPGVLTAWDIPELYRRPGR